MTFRLTSLLRLSLLLTLALPSCNRQSGPSAEELARQQQLRETAKLSQSRTTEDRLAVAEKYLAEGNAVAADQEIRPLMISQPDDPKVVLLSARIQAQSGNTQDAVATLERLDELARLDERVDSETRQEALWLAAKWLVEQSEYDRAQGKLEQMLDLPGDNVRVHRQLALILNNQGRRREAAEHLRALARSGEILEKELFAMNAYSNPFIDESMPKPKFGSELIPAALSLAREARAEGELADAAALSEKLADAFPESTPIAAFRGRVYADLQDNENLLLWSQSTPLGIEREPEYWHAMGIWMQRQERHREAIRCLIETVIRDETDRAAYYALAQSLQVLGNQEAADRAIQRADALSETAAITRELGRQRGTLDQLQRMADLLDQLGRPWEALAWRSISLKQHGGSDEQWAQWQQQRDALEKAEQAQSEKNAETLLACGLDRSQWPLPSDEAIGDMLASPQPVPEPMAEEFPLLLQDTAAEYGLIFQYDNGDDPSDESRLIHQLTGGGIGVIDFDLDGWPDLYLTQGGGDAFDADGSKPNQLFRNQQGRQWSDATKPAGTGDLGYGQGVAATDINQDGWLDLLVANIGPNVLYLNNGDGTFTRRSLPTETDRGDWTTSIGCGDLSGDHLPEIIEVNYIDDPSALTTPCTPGSTACTPRSFLPAIDRVWQVTQDGDVGPWDGCRELRDQPNYGFALVIADFDQRSGNDVFIANDTRPNHFWLSQSRQGSDEFELVESAQLYGCATGTSGLSRGCMGIAFGDFDRNQRLDLHVTNFWNEPADIYLQQSSGLFEPANQKLGLLEASRKTVGWGTQAVDLDRNGWLDLAVLNGHVSNERSRGQPFQMQPQLFRGDVSGFALVEPKRATDNYWYDSKLGRTLAVLDWNGDGRTDLIANHLDAPVALLENGTEQTGNHIRVELIGTASERDATGAVVTLTAGYDSWRGWLVGGHGFLCSNERVIDFGVGEIETLDQIEIRWPSGETQQFSNVATNQQYLIVEGNDELFARSP